MNFENVKELISIINTSEIRSFALQLDNAVVKMSKNEQDAPPLVVQSEQIKAVSNSVGSNIMAKKEIAPEAAKQEISPTAQAVDLSTGMIVKSPIVGTFYTTPGPGKPAFVNKGSKVQKGDILCIIEAMKIMNEIVSEYDGEIAEILVENESMVEYGQPLFKIV